MKKIFCIMGRSASGKSSLTKAVADEIGLKVVKSYTTRPMRPGETEKDSDHYFISEDEVSIYKNQMIAYTEINGYKYFTTIDILKHSDIYVIDPEGYQYLSDNLKKHYIKIELIPIYIRLTKDELFARACKRGDAMSVYQERYNSESPQFEAFEKALWHSGTTIIHNTNYERSVEKLRDIVLHKLPFWKMIKYKTKNLLKKNSR